jgi:hypothetical protein
MQMDEKIDLKDIEQRAWKVYMQDGLVEIMIGVIFFLASGAFHTSSSVVFLALFPTIFGQNIIEAIRKRYTYPRIGYVKLQSDDPKKTARGMFLYMVAVIAIMAVVLYLLFGSGTWAPYLLYQWLPTFIGAMLVGAMTYTKSKSGDARYYAYALVAIAIGVAFSLHRFEPVKMGVTLYLLLLSGIMIVTGLARFVVFLRNHPLPPEPESSQEARDPSKDILGFGVDPDD